MVNDNAENTKIFVEYATDLFKRSTIECLIECYLNILNKVVENLSLIHI